MYLTLKYLAQITTGNIVLDGRQVFFDNAICVAFLKILFKQRHLHRLEGKYALTLLSGVIKRIDGY